MMGWNTNVLLLVGQLLVLPLVFGIALEEPVPERFLPPRNYNPHPFTDVVRRPKVHDQLNIPAPSDIYAHYTQHRRPAYKDQEYRQYASVDQQLAYEANVDDYIANAHHHQDFDTSVNPIVSPTANYDLQARSYHHEQLSGTSENPVRHFTQVTHHAQGHYTSKSVQHRSDHFSQKPYSFAYAVVDDQSGDDFSHSQANNGHATQGEYRVKLPDGRTQVVRYTADNGGYRADVSYEATPGLPLAAAPAAPFLLQPSAQLTHVTPSPFYAVKNAFYGGGGGQEVIPGHSIAQFAKATSAGDDDDAATQIQPAQLAFEQHLVYKRMSQQHQKQRRVRVH